MGGDKKKEKEKKVVSDDFYDKINYRESRNIFSSNEAFNPENRLYTENAGFTHAVWDKIRNPDKDETGIDNKAKQRFEHKSEFTDSLVNSITKLNTSTSYQPIGCKKCGHGNYFFKFSGALCLSVL
jgi:hypothetical protein